MSTVSDRRLDCLITPHSMKKSRIVCWNVAMGQAMPPPIGWIDKTNYTIAVRDEPVVMRAFLPNPAGGQPFPRGIAVGMPELINYCFDAQTCTLRYAWTGGFLDMQPSWSGRGGNVVKLLGKRFYTTGLFPLQVGEFGSSTAREFVGYAFADKKPQFVYRLGDVEVHEAISAPDKALGLVRSFELDSRGKPVSFFVADDPGVSYESAAGAFEPTEVLVDPAKPKVSGRVLKLKGGPAVKFSVTITVKESK